VTHKGDTQLAAALSEARDQAASATSECEALRREMRLLSGELQESREQETRLRRGQDAEMQLAQEAAAVAAGSSVSRAQAEEENLALVEQLIEIKVCTLLLSCCICHVCICRHNIVTDSLHIKYLF
jgi:hypothetical protein